MKKIQKSLTSVINARQNESENPIIKWKNYILEPFEMILRRDFYTENLNSSCLCSSCWYFHELHKVSDAHRRMPCFCKKAVDNLLGPRYWISCWTCMKVHGALMYGSSMKQFSLWISEANMSEVIGQRKSVHDLFFFQKFKILSAWKFEALDLKKSYESRRIILKTLNFKCSKNHHWKLTCHKWNPFWLANSTKTWDFHFKLVFVADFQTR